MDVCDIIREQQDFIWGTNWAGSRDDLEAVVKGTILTCVDR
jgi:hypothetical protein